MGIPRLSDFELDEALVDAIREQEARRRRAFTQITVWGSLTIWICWSTLLYLLWLKTDSPARLALSLALGLIPAVFALVPLSVLATFACSLFWPRHRQAAQLDRYDEARGHVRPCDVCIMALQDRSPKADVHFCPRCDAWICEACRHRYDLRAIAALKRRVLPPPPG